MSRETTQTSVSGSALFTCQGIGMVAVTVTSYSTCPQKLFLARRALYRFVHLFGMPLKADEFIILAATDLAFVAFPPTYGWNGRLTITARETNEVRKYPFSWEGGTDSQRTPDHRVELSQPAGRHPSFGRVFSPSLKAKKMK